MSEEGSSSLLWLDALTPKHARLVSSLKKVLSDRYRIFVTAREYAETTGILELEGVEYTRIGKHGGPTKLGKLLAYAERTLQLAKLISSIELPDALISFSSPSAVRVAFGLGIPAVSLNDTPHATHVCRLTFPLSARVISPSAIPREELLKLGATEGSLIQYDGVDEVLWVREYNPDPSTLSWAKQLGSPLVVLRPLETEAAYMGGRSYELTGLVEFLVREGAKVVLFPRYKWQERFAREGVIIPNKVLDTLTLYKVSSLVISGGGTMAREGALLGTPSISLFPLNIPLYVNDYLSKLGFPLWRFRSWKDAIPLIRKVLRDPNSMREDTSSLLKKLETPLSAVERALNELGI